MSGVTITSNQHGKARVRVAKVRRNKNGVHDIMEMNVQLLLQGSCMISSFTEGDNSNVS
jgi:urate oxidase